MNRVDKDNDYLDLSDEEEYYNYCEHGGYSSDEGDLGIASFNDRINSCEQVSDEDDFEKEMAEELSLTMQKLTTPLIKGSDATTSGEGSGQSEAASSKGTKRPAVSSEKSNSEFYDAIYFDSDEDDDTSANRGVKTPGGGAAADFVRPKNPKHQRHKMLSDDELLYDPTSDDRDQRWVDQQRRQYQVKQKTRRSKPKSKADRESVANELPPLPRSDAVLNCPACLTTLCLDCQQHSIYKDQYRAMFVKNCLIDFSQTLHYPSKENKKKMFKEKLKQKRKRQRGGEQAETNPTSPQPMEEDESASAAAAGASTTEMRDELAESTTNADDAAKNPDELFHSVACGICNTKVAVYDKEEVYHFFNVVTSY